MFGGVIEVSVEEKPKSIRLELLRNTFRYSPILIDCLFTKSNVYYLKIAQINGSEYTRKHALLREQPRWDQKDST